MKTKIHYGNKVSTVKGNTVYFAIRNWNYLTSIQLSCMDKAPGEDNRT